MSAFKTIIYEKRENVAWITLNRPEVLNAQNDQMREELIQALEDARDDENIYVIVLTGAGDRAFSAGADISEFPKIVPSDLIKRSGKLRHYDLIRSIPKPVIAAVNGYALGGGCELAMACDIIIASENATFGQPEIRVGVIPGGGGTQILPRLVGEKIAKEMIFTGKSITAQEAYRLGMINKVVPKEKLLEEVNNLVGELLKRSPIILALAKLAVNKALETTLTEGLKCETDLFKLCFSTEDQKEASKAFLEKRQPILKGR
ncbi:MAG: enoyl-CoA hydratase-related protein [Candidatus Bathyarchaeia archaeon]